MVKLTNYIMAVFLALFWLSHTMIAMILPSILSPFDTNPGILVLALYNLYAILSILGVPTIMLGLLISPDENEEDVK